MAILPLLVGPFVILLPATMKKPLPQTVADVEAWDEVSFWGCVRRCTQRNSAATSSEIGKKLSSDDGKCVVNGDSKEMRVEEMECSL